MARYTGPRTRISRRFGVPIFGPSKYLERRNYGPGVHGPKSRRKTTDYGLGLIEKQKLRYYYGLMERQFRGVYEKALKRRGVTGDPSSWTVATGIVPKTLAQAVGPRPATIQDKWFARLYLAKALMIASLALFWTASGFIALFVSYSAATDILHAHGFPPDLVAPVTILTSLMDMGIGILIAFRRTSAFGLIAGIAASLGYMVGAAILTPDLWIEPLGALVKTGPAIVLMLVALLTLDNR